MHENGNTLRPLGRVLGALIGMSILASLGMFTGTILFEHFGVALLIVLFASIATALVLPIPTVWHRATIFIVRSMGGVFVFVFTLSFWVAVTMATGGFSPPD